MSTSTSNQLRHDTREKFAAALFASHARSTEAIGRCGVEQDDGSLVISGVVWQAVKAWATQPYAELHEHDQLNYIMEADDELVPIIEPILAVVVELEQMAAHWETWE